MAIWMDYNHVSSPVSPHILAYFAVVSLSKPKFATHIKNPRSFCYYNKGEMVM